MSYLELLKLAAPEAIIVVTALVVLAIGLVSKRGAGLCSGIAGAGILFAIAALGTLPQDANLFHGMLVSTPLTVLFKVICLVLALFTVILAHDDRSLQNRGEYLALLLLATIGMMLLVGSEELLMIFIGLELLGLSLYVMTAFDRREVYAAEAAMKYFLFGSTASAFTLFGISLVYGMTGATGLAAIAQRLGSQPASPLLFAGLVMTLVGFAFKVAAAPFHLWAPDAYQGAPVPTAAFIASGSKVASFVVLGKILLGGFAAVSGSAAWHDMIAGWAPIIAMLAALSILLGNLIALVQKNVRRLLAYSAVAHGGYTLLGLIVADREGFSATLFYTTIYAFTLVGAFGVVGAVRRETGSDDLQNFAGLRTRSPLLAGCMTIFLLSLAGLPPLAGFFGKFYLFSATLRGGDHRELLWLVVIALFGSLISLYYYLVVLKTIFAEPVEIHPRKDFTMGRMAHGAFLQRISLVLLALLILFLGVAPSFLVGRILAALQ